MDEHEDRERTLKAFGRHVRKIREAKTLTQEAVAEKADLDATYISGIERGVRNPSIWSIVRVARALGISVSDLCKGMEA